MALDALGQIATLLHPQGKCIDPPAVNHAIQRGVRWLAEQTAGGAEISPAPIGFYFAKLWYFEREYPLIYAVAGLGRAVNLAIFDRTQPDSQDP